MLHKMETNKNQTDLLVVVDVQNGFVNEKSQHVVEPISCFVQDWIDAGKKVVFTRFINLPGSQWEKLIGWTRLCDSPEIDLHPNILFAVKDSDTVRVIDKYSYSSFTPELEEIIAREEPGRILICGIATDQCVLQTAVDLFENKKIPIVLSDLCASEAGNEAHEAGLFLLRRFIGKNQVIVSDTV